MILHYFIIDLMNKSIKLVYDGHNDFFFSLFFLNHKEHCTPPKNVLCINGTLIIKKWPSFS